MGANARRRHGAVDMTPKVATPYASRTVPMVYDKAGMGHPSRRAQKKLKGYIDTVVNGNLPHLQPEDEKLLDPKPFRIGRKRYTIEEAASYTEDDKVIFSPRSGYEQNIPRYAEMIDNK